MRINEFMHKRILEERSYAWEYFKIHAKQRLETFHLFVLIMTLLLGAILTLLDEKSSFLICLTALLMSLFSFIFWKLDQRNRELIEHAEIELARIENKLGPKLVTEEKNKTLDKKSLKQSFIFYMHFTYSECFKWAFLAFGFTGLLIIGWVIIGLKINPIFISSDKFQDFNILIFFVFFVFLWGIFSYIFSTISKLSTVILSFLLAVLFTTNIKIFHFENLIQFKVGINNNPPKDQPKNTLHEKIVKLKTTMLYFDKGDIEIRKKLNDKNIFAVAHFNNIIELERLLIKLDKTNNYYIKIIGFASTEKVIQRNKVTDNYQISYARADNTKEYISNFLGSNNFLFNHIKFDVFAKSNQLATDNSNDSNRRVVIEVYGVMND